MLIPCSFIELSLSLPRGPSFKKIICLFTDSDDVLRYTGTLDLFYVNRSTGACLMQGSRKTVEGWKAVETDGVSCIIWILVVSAILIWFARTLVRKQKRQGVQSLDRPKLEAVTLFSLQVLFCVVDEQIKRVPKGDPAIFRKWIYHLIIST